MPNNLPMVSLIGSRISAIFLPITNMPPPVSPARISPAEILSLTQVAKSLSLSQTQSSAVPILSNAPENASEIAVLNPAKELVPRLILSKNPPMVFPAFWAMASKIPNCLMLALSSVSQSPKAAAPENRPSNMTPAPLLPKALAIMSPKLFTAWMPMLMVEKNPEAIRLIRSSVSALGLSVSDHALNFCVREYT